MGLTIRHQATINYMHISPSFWVVLPTSIYWKQDKMLATKFLTNISNGSRYMKRETKISKKWDYEVPNPSISFFRNPCDTYTYIFQISNNGISKALSRLASQYIWNKRINNSHILDKSFESMNKIKIRKWKAISILKQH